MLEWQLKNYKMFGRLEQFKKMKEAGMSVPFLDDVPTVNPRFGWLMDSYHILAGQRQVTDQGLMPIPISEIAAYAKYVGITDEVDRLDLLHIITKLDAVALSYAAEARAEADRKSRRKAAAAQKKAPRRARGR